MEHSPTLMAEIGKDVALTIKGVASANSDLLEDMPGLIEVTDKAVMLAKGGSIEVADAMNTLTSSLNQFGAGAEEASRFVNVLAAGSKVGASEVGETGVAIIKSGVAARRAGLSFEELNASIQVLATGGIKAEVAGTGLQTVFLRLEKQTNNRFKPSVVGLQQALENLGEANLTTAQLSDLFGTEAIKQGATLIDLRNKLKQFTRDMTGTNVATEQARIRMDTFDKKLESIGITITDKLISAFIDLQPEIDEAVAGMTLFIGSISSADFREFMDNIKIILRGLMLVAKAFGHVMRVFKVLGTAIGEHIARVVENPLNLLPHVGIANIIKSATGGDELSELDDRVADLMAGRRIGPNATAAQLNEIVQSGIDIGGSMIQEPGTMKGHIELVLKDPSKTAESVKAKSSTPSFIIGVNNAPRSAAQ